MNNFKKAMRDAGAAVAITVTIAVLWVYEKCGGKPFQK